MDGDTEEDADDDEEEEVEEEEEVVALCSIPMTLVLGEDGKCDASFAAADNAAANEAALCRPVIEFDETIPTPPPPPPPPPAPPEADKEEESCALNIFARPNPPTLHCPEASIKHVSGFTFRCTTAFGLCSCRYVRACAMLRLQRAAIDSGTFFPLRLLHTDAMEPAGRYSNSTSHGSPFVHAPKNWMTRG